MTKAQSGSGIETNFQSSILKKNCSDFSFCNLVKIMQTSNIIQGDSMDGQGSLHKAEQSVPRVYYSSVSQLLGRVTMPRLGDLYWDLEYFRASKIYKFILNKLYFIKKIQIQSLATIEESLADQNSLHVSSKSSQNDHTISIHSVKVKKNSKTPFQR